MMMEDIKMSVYGYVRVSTTNQVEKGLSLKEQTRQIELYAEVNKLEVDKVFTERGVSASIDLYQRPLGSKLMDVVQDGDVIICSKLDRMFRSCLDGLQVLNQLKEKNVELHFIDLGGNTTTNGIGKLMFSIMSSFAEMERNRIGERIRDTKHLQMKMDVFTGGIVGYGYQVDEYGDKKYVVENKEEQKIITRMKKMRKSGTSFRNISKELERDGIRMTHMTVSNILRDEEKNKLKTRRVKEKIKSSFLLEKPSNSLNPVVGKMKQEIIKKQQKSVSS